MNKLTRRDFLDQTLRAGVGMSLLPLAYACSGSKASSFNKKIIILGMDGLDPNLLKQFVYEGVMPNFLRLIHAGSFRKMRSSIPPQSPVAWSDFAVGANAAVHGIFDFIHRDPRTMFPYFSTSEVSESSNTISIGGWEIPLSGADVKQLREGTPFWEYLGEAGIPTTIYKMPGNFPTQSKKANCVSGMGTPDILGSYGTFSFYTTEMVERYEKVTGGKVIPVTVKDNKIITELTGPVNTLKKDRSNITVPLVIWLDPKNDVARIKVQEHERIMVTGEWSDWIQLSFDFLPYVNSAKGIVKIYIKQIHPNFEMYITPINIDPSDQALPVTSPPDFGEKLVQKIGLFGTKGLPADTKALSYSILSEDEYLQMSRQILDESKSLLRYELDQLRKQSSGVLFFYFSNVDQDSHMFWRAIDRDHPLYTPSQGRRYADVIKKMYIEMDNILGKIFKRFDIGNDQFRLIVMSDHGFAPFNRCVNLNTWLLENGYISLINSNLKDRGEFFQYVDWSNTKAYGLGINALYINRKNREQFGTVRENEVPRLLEKLQKELLELRDPVNSINAITNVWQGEALFKRNDEKVPDLIIGWSRGYRASWETILGGFPQNVFTNNDDKWSGDHCIDPLHVPASLLSNQKISLRNPSLPDVTATILAECNIPIPAQMTGNPLYEI